MSIDLSNATFQGYRRENGRMGVRNHVIILPVDDLSNAACQAVANNIQGTMAIPHPYGRLQFGADLDLHFRTLIGTGANPNVHSVVVIGRCLTSTSTVSQHSIVGRCYRFDRILRREFQRRRRCLGYLFFVGVALPQRVERRKGRRARHERV